jgi:hypothetical protein
VWRSLLLTSCVTWGFGYTTAAVAQAPAGHYGTGVRLIGPSECIRRAKADIRARGWTYNVTGNSTIVGGARTLTSVGPNVSVMVNCVILGLGTATRSNILVAAWSRDGRLAERIRNEVRSAVMR